jgi:hypothetical protein
MKLHTLAAACAALVTFSATSAFAVEPVTAKLQQPVAAKTKIIAGGAMFTCEADACIASAPGSETFSTAACKTLAGKVGPISAFTGRKALDDDRLTQCNVVAVTRAAATTQLAKQ